jgi:hypothetical protein
LGFQRQIRASQNEELSDLFRSSIIVRILKPRRLYWAGSRVTMDEKGLHTEF